MEIITFNGFKYEVIKRYQLSDEYMKENQLYYKNRIRIRNLETGRIEDFANTSNM